MLDLAQLEKLIESVVFESKPPANRFEDYLQEARVAAWEYALENEVTEENLNTHVKSIVAELKKVLRRTRNQDSYGTMREASLDATFGPDSTGTLKDVIPSDAETALEQLIRIEEEIPEQEVVPTWELLKELVRRSLETRAEEDKQVVVYLLVQLLGIDEDQVTKEVTYATFVENGLQRWLWVFFNNSPFRAINCAYPGKFLPYHMAKAPNKTWTGRGGWSRSLKALRTALGETGVDPEHYPRVLTYRLVKEFKLERPLLVRYKTLYAFLNAAYPGRYYPWEMSVTLRGYFEDEENVKKAARWLVEEKLGFEMSRLSKKGVWDKRVAMKVTRSVFEQYGLREIMATYKSPKPVLTLVYPDKFYEWSFPNQGKWKGPEGKALAARTVRWFVEDYLRQDPKHPNVTFHDFVNGGLHGLITAKALGFNSSPKAALENAYPKAD